MNEHDKQLLAIFSSNEKRLRRYFARRSLSHEECEDLAQETWIKFARNGLSAFAAPVPYLMRIARTLVIDHDRTARRRLTHQEVDALLFVADENPGPEHALEARDQLRLLATIIESLPARRRAILLAARVEGRKLSAIAQELDVSVRTVELELRAAVDHCRERLDALNKI